MLKQFSEFLRINVFDFIKAAFIATVSGVLSFVAPIVNEAIETGNFEVQANWRMILRVALCSFIAYLIKQISTNSNGQLFKKEKKPAS